jgi:small subunit ribosomal protein S9
VTDSEPKPTETPASEATPAPTPETEPTPAPAPPTPETSAPSAVDETPHTETPPPAETETATYAPRSKTAGLLWGTGRRKSAVARVRVMPGDGQFLINKREIEEYFSEDRDRGDVIAPLTLLGVRKQWDVHINVRGGGISGQAGAIRLGLARALVRAYAEKEQDLRNAGYLTRDARRVERKKPGRRKARRRFQFSKR